MADAWADLASTLPAAAPETLRKGLHDAFFCGAVSLMQVILAAARTEDGTRRVDAVFAEVDAFTQGFRPQ